jgi:CHAT domain-containing protein
MIRAGAVLRAAFAVGFCLAACRPRTDPGNLLEQVDQAFAAQWHSPVAVAGVPGRTCVPFHPRTPVPWCVAGEGANHDDRPLAQWSAALRRRFVQDSSPAVVRALVQLELLARPDAASLDQVVALQRWRAERPNAGAAVADELAAVLLVRYASTRRIDDLLEAHELLASNRPVTFPPYQAPAVDAAAGLARESASCANLHLVRAWAGVPFDAPLSVAGCADARSPVTDRATRPGESWPQSRDDSLALAEAVVWPEFSYDMAWGHLLPMAASALVAGDQGAAAALLRAAECIGTALAAHGVDSSVARTAAQLQRTATTVIPPRSLLVQLAQYGALRRGEPRPNTERRRALREIARTIQRYATDWPDLTDQVRMTTASMDLIGQSAQPGTAHQAYQALQRRHARQGTVFAQRLAYNDALASTSLGDHADAASRLDVLARDCARRGRRECQQGAAAMGAAVAQLAGDDERNGSLLAVALEAGPLPWRLSQWTLLAALRERASRLGWAHAAQELFDASWTVAARLRRPDLQADELVSLAHASERAGDHVRLRRHALRLDTLLRDMLSPEDRAYFEPERQWLMGAVAMADGQTSARALLDSSVSRLAADSNSTRSDRPMLTRARAYLASGDSLQALLQLDSLLRRLSRRGTNQGTYFDRVRAMELAGEAGWLAASVLLHTGRDAQLVQALSGQPFLHADWPATDSHRTASLLLRRWRADTVFLWFRSPAGWQRAAVRVSPEDIRRTSTTFARADLEALHAAFIAPVISSDPTLGSDRRTHLRIDARGDLASIPWTALVDPRTGRYLVEKIGVVLTDDSWRVPTSTAVRADASVTVIDAAPGDGVMALPGAQREVAAVAARWPKASVLPATIGGDALLKSLRTSVLVHFSGHGVLDASRPERSYLMLSGDGRQRIDGGHFARADLRGVQVMILAACQSSADGRRRGPAMDRDAPWARSGLATLAHAIVAAGVHEVIGAGWPVDDRATALFMADLHDALRQSMAPRDALRAAQLRSLQSTDPTQRSPRAWAAFQLVGR